MTEPAHGRTRPHLVGVADLVLELGTVVMSGETLQSVADLVCGSAAVAVPGVAGAGVVLVDSRGRRTTATSDPLVQAAAALEDELGSGPCLTACSEQVPVWLDDLGTDARWPEWAAAAARLGVGSVASLPLVVRDVCVGTISVCSRRAGVYDAQTERVLGLLSEHAAVLVTNMMALADARRLGDDLAGALGRRDVIGQAKGVLIARGAGDPETAFALLVATSQSSNQKLHEVARALVASVTSA